MVMGGRRNRSLKRTLRSGGEVDVRTLQKTEPKVTAGPSWRLRWTLGESQGGTP